MAQECQGARHGTQTSEPDPDSLLCDAAWTRLQMRSMGEPELKLMPPVSVGSPSEHHGQLIHQVCRREARQGKSGILWILHQTFAPGLQSTRIFLLIKTRRLPGSGACVPACGCALS